MLCNSTSCEDPEAGLIEQHSYSNTNNDEERQGHGAVEEDWHLQCSDCCTARVSPRNGFSADARRGPGSFRRAFRSQFVARLRCDWPRFAMPIVPPIRYAEMR